MSKRSVRKLAGTKIVLHCGDEPTIQAGGDDKPARFSMVLYAGGPIRPGGWTKPHPLVVDLAGMQVVRNGEIPFNRGHGGDQALVGHGRAVVQAESVIVEDGVFSFTNEHTEQILSSSKAGFRWASSMEATLLSTPEFIAAGRSVVVNGRKIEGPVYVARKTELFAGAFIGSNPADRTTEVSIAAREREMPKEVKEWLESRGIDCDGLTDNQIKAFCADYEAIHASSEGAEDEPEGDDPVAAIRAASVAETKRIGEISKMFGDRFPEIKASCIGDGLTIEAAQMKFDRAALDEEIANTPKAPAGHVSASGELMSCDVFAAALHANSQPDIRHSDFIAEVYGEKNAELADKLPKTAGLKYLLHQTIRAAGGHIEAGLSTDNELLVKAFQCDRRLRQNQDIFAASAFSTFSLTDTLSNVAHKMLMREYRDWPSLVDVLCDMEEHTDFKEHTKVLVEGDVDALELAPTGEIKHGTLSDAKYTSSLVTFARMLSVTRVDFINDDLGAFNRRARMLGRGQMQNREKLMFITLLNPANVGTFFKDAAAAAAATGQDAKVVNRLTGQGNPSATMLKNAENLMLEMENETGDPIMVSPEFILSSTKQRKDFTDLLVRRTTSVYDANQAAGTARTELRIENEYLGVFGHRDSPYVNQRPSIPGSADNLSFLFGNKTDAAGLEYIILRGAPSPTIQSAETDFNTLGTQMRTWWDIGFAMRNPRGIVRIEA